jgi:hypothetical protein
MMKKTVLLLALVPLLSGCALLKLPGMPTPKGPQTVYNWQETVTKKARPVKIDDKIFIVQDEVKELIVGYEKVTPKKTFIEKIGSWISGLGMIGFVLLVIGLVLAPTATIGFLFATLRKWKNAMRETVSGIKESRLIDKDNGLKASLTDKQSTKTKLLVDSIKRTM